LSSLIALTYRVRWDCYMWLTARQKSCGVCSSNSSGSRSSSS